MQETDKLFFELIRIAIGNQVCLSRTPKVKEWQELYAMAKKQSLVGICFAGVQKLQAQRQAPNSWDNEQGGGLYLQWMGMAAKIQQRNEVVNRQCVEVQAKLSSDGYRTCLLKGQGNAQSYSTDLKNLRQSGDIDIWVDGERKDVIAYVQRISPTDDISHQHARLDIINDTTSTSSVQVEVELHFVPSELEYWWTNRILQRYYDEARREQFANNTVSLGDTGLVNIPTVEFNLVFQMTHIYRHLFGEGIGLRQVMDYYFVLLHSMEEERKEAMTILRKLKMERFAGALMYVLEKTFGLDPSFDICKPDEVTGKILLDDIMMSGNFGRAQGVVENDNWFKRTIRFTRKNMHLLQYYPTEVIADPFWRLWHFGWRKKHGFK